MSLNTTITGSTSNYLIHGMISSFYFSANRYQELIITFWPTLVPNVALTLNSNIASILFYNDITGATGSSTSKLCFTVILVDVTSFNNQLVYYPQVESVNLAIAILAIPNEFNPHQSQKCMLGIIWFGTGSTAFTMTLTDNGVSPNSSLSIVNTSL
jgi:hypothetical protein